MKVEMKRINLIILICLLLMLGIIFTGCDNRVDCEKYDGGGNSSSGYPEKGDTLDDFTLIDCDGNLVNLSDFSDKKAILLSVHAGWCSVCKQQAATLEDQYQKYKEKGFITLAFVTEDEYKGHINGEYCTNYKEHYNMTHPVLIDPHFQLSKNWFDSGSAPLNIILDGNRKIHHIMVGAADSSIDRTIEELVD